MYYKPLALPFIYHEQLSVYIATKYYFETKKGLNIEDKHNNVNNNKIFLRLDIFLKTFLHKSPWSHIYSAFHKK